MKKFDLEAAKAGAQVVTRDGKKVRILCFDLNKPLYKVVALVSISENEESLQTYTETGLIQILSEDNYDLFMAPQKKEYWVNVYRKVPDGIFIGAVHSSHIVATEQLGIPILSTVKIYEEEV